MTRIGDVAHSSHGVSKSELVQPERLERRVCRVVAHAIDSNQMTRGNPALALTGKASALDVISEADEEDEDTDEVMTGELDDGRSVASAKADALSVIPEGDEEDEDTDDESSVMTGIDSVLTGEPEDGFSVASEDVANSERGLRLGESAFLKQIKSMFWHGVSK